MNYQFVIYLCGNPSWYQNNSYKYALISMFDFENALYTNV